MKKKIRKIQIIFVVEIDFESQNFAILTDFYASLPGPKKNYWEGPVRCAKVCDKSWFIL